MIRLQKDEPRECRTPRLIADQLDEGAPYLNSGRFRWVEALVEQIARLRTERVDIAASIAMRRSLGIRPYGEHDKITASGIASNCNPSPLNQPPCDSG